MLLITNTPPIVAINALHVVTSRVAASWPWYVVRAAGFVAAGLLFALMLSGIGQVTGLTYRFIEPVKAWALHKALAIALCLSIAVHVGFLFLDHYLPFSLLQAFVPFQSSYNNKTAFLGLPLGSLAITFGIVATYLIVIVVLSSLGWIQTKPKRWHNLHYLSYILVFLVFLHALYAGSDLKYGLFRAAWIFGGFIIVLGIASRLWRAGTHRSD